MPPSPKPPKFLVGKNEKVEISPKVPQYLFLNLTKCAWAQSSIKKIFFSLHNLLIFKISHGFPYKWTTITAFVLEFIFFF